MQCGIGCTLWESALDASCQEVCVSKEIHFHWFSLHEKWGIFFHLSEQNGDERLRQSANLLRERMQRCVKLLLSMDQAGSVVASRTSARPRFSDIDVAFTRVVRSIKVSRPSERKFIQKDQKRNLFRTMLRRIWRRLENMRSSDYLWELNDSHGTIATVHKIQSETEHVAQWIDLTEFISVPRGFAAVWERSDLLWTERRHQHEWGRSSRVAAGHWTSWSCRSNKDRSHVEIRLEE